MTQPKDIFFLLKSTSIVVNHWSDNAGTVNMNSNKKLTLEIKLFSETPHLVSHNTLI